VWSIAAAVFVTLLAALIWRFGAAASLTLRLAAPAVGSILDVAADVAAPEEISIPGPAGELRADLYRPTTARGALLLVHGLSRAGRRQPDLVRLAGLLASHGLVVVVPQFEGLAAFRLTGQEVADIGAALRETASISARRGVGSVGVAGFSFGAGPTLIAAADVPNLRVVGSFGGYAQLVHVITFITTGTHEHGGRRYLQKQEEYNRWKLLAMMGGLVADQGDRRRLDAIAERRLANPADDTALLERDLGTGGQAMLALVVNRREDRVAELVAALPQSARVALDRLSPLTAVPRIRGRLLIAHGMADESIPYTESLRLAEAAGDRAHLAVFETFHHTGPQPLWRSAVNRAGDARRLLGVVDELLGR
jgi:hypothetical protein